MSEEDRKRYVLELIRLKVRDINTHYIKCASEYSAIQTSYRLTEEAISKEEYGGGFGSSNRYGESLKRAQVVLDCAKKANDEWVDVYNYIIDKLLKL